MKVNLNLKYYLYETTDDGTVRRKFASKRLLLEALSESKADYFGLLVEYAKEVNNFFKDGNKKEIRDALEIFTSEEILKEVASSDW